MELGCSAAIKDSIFHNFAQTYLQLPLWQWVGGNFYLLVLSSWKVNIVENPIAVMGLYTGCRYVQATQNF